MKPLNKLQRGTLILAVLAVLSILQGDWRMAGGIFIGWYVTLISGGEAQEGK